MFYVQIAVTFTCISRFKFVSHSHIKFTTFLLLFMYWMQYNTDSVNAKYYVMFSDDGYMYIMTHVLNIMKRPVLGLFSS